MFGRKRKNEAKKATISKSAVGKEKPKMSKPKRSRLRGCLQTAVVLFILVLGCGVVANLLPEPDQRAGGREPDAEALSLATPVPAGHEVVDGDGEQEVEETAPTATGVNPPVSVVTVVPAEVTAIEKEGNMARKLEIEWQDDVETLRAAYRTAKDGQDRQRLHAMMLLRQGKSLAETAALLDVHYRTVQEWVSWYRQGGLRAVLGHRHGGSRIHARRLSAEQEAELKQKADAGEIHRIEDGVHWAQENHQVPYTYWGIRHVFARLGLRQKVPRPRNPKACALEQEAWKKGS